MIKPSVSVIIPTTCETRREASLFRAINSVQTQEDVDHRLVLIVNGDRVNSHLYETLKTAKGLEIHRLSEGNYPHAVRYGRSLVETEYFSYLDDDDEYLPRGLIIRAAPMLDNHQIDFVATNGYRNVKNVDKLMLDETSDIEKNPLESLLNRNWLASCGGLFRSATVTSDYFDPEVHASEWTYLAFRLSQKLSMRFLDVPTFRIYDSPQSLSKSLKWVTWEVKALEKMISLKPKASLLPVLYKRRSDVLHSIADLHRNLGNYSLAWRFHLRSLQPSGWNHVWFTRKLLIPRRRVALHPQGFLENDYRNADANGTR